MAKVRTDTDKAIIVAACNGENTEWTKPLLDDWMVFIEREYRPKGREAWAYLKWICAYYRDCPETVVLVQGDPFRHDPKFLDNLYSDCLYYGRMTQCDKTGSPQWTEDMNHWCEYFDLPEQDDFVFPEGAQYRLTRDNIHNRTEKFYQECFKVADTNDRSGYVFERIFPIIFGLTL